MRIHLDGDWSATWVFGLASIPMVLAAFFLAEAERFDSGVQYVMYAIAGVYVVIAIVMGVCAKRGRDVPDNSTWVSWKNTGGDAWMTFGSAVFLYFAGFGTVMFFADAALSSLHDWGMLGAVAVGLLVVVWGIVQLNFAARVVVFTPQKEVMILKGKPCALLPLNNPCRKAGGSQTAVPIEPLNM